jgi:Uma2 family endonuclease
MDTLLSLPWARRRRPELAPATLISIVEQAVAPRNRVVLHQPFPERRGQRKMSKIMATITDPQTTMPLATSGWIPSPLYRMSVEQYEALVASGTFKDYNRFKLINGCLVAKMTQNPPHALADELCGDALAHALPGWCIRGAKPVRLPQRSSMPEPDRCVVRGSQRDYAARHPGPDDVVLVIEVAEPSLSEDRKMATEVYGPSGIPVYWIVNLIDRQVEVYTDPKSTGYASRIDYKPGQLVPVVIDGQQLAELAADDILP